MHQRDPYYTPLPLFNLSISVVPTEASSTAPCPSDTLPDDENTPSPPLLSVTTPTRKPGGWSVSVLTVIPPHSRPELDQVREAR